MLKKRMKFKSTPTLSQKRSLQRSLAELNNVRDVAFEENCALLQLYTDLPDEVLVEHTQVTPDVQVVSLK